MLITKLLNLINPHLLSKSWLPSRGNMLFTLLVAFVLWQQGVGAYSLASPSASTTTIAYQGRLAQANGTTVTGMVAMEFRLYATAIGGSALWTETWAGSTMIDVDAGLFNVLLGSLTPIPQTVISNNSTLWLGIRVGSDAELTPRVQLGSVPYAIQALTVPDGSITSAKIADGSVTQQDAPTLLQSVSGESVKVSFGEGEVPVTIHTDNFTATISITPTSFCPHKPLVIVQALFSHHPDVIATVGQPMNGNQFTVYFRRKDGDFWEVNQDQGYHWIAICD